MKNMTKQNKEYQKQYRIKNRSKIRKRSRDWTNKNREKRTLQARKSYLKKKFNITIEEFERLLIKQNYKCAICGIDYQRIVDVKGRNKPNLYVDHNHKNNKIRGLLCRNCNIGLGCLKDSLDNLNSAIEYLQL